MKGIRIAGSLALVWLTLPVTAMGGSLELRVQVDADGAKILDARPSDAQPDAFVPGAPSLEVFAADGLPHGVASLPDPRIRTVIAPEGGHGDTARLVRGVVRVRVPWEPGASLRFAGRALAVPTPALATRSPAPSGAVQLIDSGPAAQRLDLVFLGDGYTSAELGDFADDVDRMVDYLLSIEPYGAYADMFNVWRIDVASTQSGASHDELGTTRNTAFDCAYGCAGISRLVCCDDNAVLSAVNEAVPGADGVMVLINDPTYGGSGGFNYATSYAGGPGDLVVPTQVAAHELGHSLVGLWDEYGYGSSGSGRGPNCSPQDDGSAWSEWVGTQGVGAFQECSYTNLYRPTLDECMMRTLRDDYCPVCRQEAVLAMYRRLPGLLESVSVEPGTEVPPDGVLEVTTHAPAKLLTFEWMLDGEVVGTGQRIELECSGLEGELSLAVRDDSPWLRTDEVQAELGPWTVKADECDRPVRTALGCTQSAGSMGALAGALALAVGYRRRSKG